MVPGTGGSEPEEVFMQRAAAFFGGAVLGGVISAACGFDLFREDGDSARRVALERSQEELQKTKGLLAKARELLSKSGERTGELTVMTGALDASIVERPGSSRERDERSHLLEEQLGKSRAEADRLRGEAARLANEAAAARHAFASAAVEVRKWKGQIHQQLLRFFSKERNAEDATLVSQYLASSISKDEKQALVLELIKRNKEVLLSLPHEATEPERARVEESGSSVVGATAKEEPAAPAKGSP